MSSVLSGSVVASCLELLRTSLDLLSDLPQTIHVRHRKSVSVETCVEKNPSIKVHRVADPPFFSKSKFNFSSVSSSLVLCLSAVAGCSSLLSRVKPLAKGWFQLASVSWPSCRQQASLFMHGHGRAAFPFLLRILLLFQILGRRCRIFQSIKDPPF